MTGDCEPAGKNHLDCEEQLTSIVCMNSAMTPFILSNISAFVTSCSAFEINVIAAWHIECHNSSTYNDLSCGFDSDALSTYING